MLAKDLGDNQKEEFTKLFYELLDVTLDDGSCSAPWGCPWFWGGVVELRGKTVEEMVKGFIDEYQDEIHSLLAEDKKRGEEEYE